MFLSRDYISQVENGREPSLRFVQQLDHLERTLGAAHGDAYPVGTPQPATTLEETPANLPRSEQAEKRRAIYAELDRLLAAAGDNVERLAWLLEQMRAQVAIMPRHWGPALSYDEAEAAHQARIEEARLRMRRELGREKAQPQPSQRQTG